MDFAFYDGNILPLCEVKFGFRDRSVFFGDGVYDAMIGNQKGIYMLKEHLERFQKNLSLLSLTLPYGEDEIIEILNTLLAKTGEGDRFLYIQASRDREERRHSAYGFQNAHFFAYAKSFELPDENKGLSLVCVEDNRYALCHIKTVNLLPNVLASTYAEQMGADEAVFIKDGIVRECSHSNISILQNGALITHPLDCHILPGIMRGALIEGARKLGITVEERYYTKEDIFLADGVFITSTTRRVAMANMLDGIALPPPKKQALALHSLVNSDFFEKML